MAKPKIQKKIEEEHKKSLTRKRKNVLHSNFFFCDAHNFFPNVPNHRSSFPPVTLLTIHLFHAIHSQQKTAHLVAGERCVQLSIGVLHQHKYKFQLGYVQTLFYYVVYTHIYKYVPHPIARVDGGALLPSHCHLYSSIAPPKPFADWATGKERTDWPHA